MNIFVFTGKNKTEKSIVDSILSRYIKTHGMIGVAKIIGLFIVWLAILVTYLYNVNLASTSGYFLRQATQKHTSVKFKLDILKTHYLTLKQRNREKLHNYRYSNSVVDVATEYVYVPDKIEYVYR